MGSDLIGIIGLGYVGLPLAVEFGKHREVIGFDVNSSRISELKNGKDITREVEHDELLEAKHLTFSDSAEDLKNCSIFIITVPTPIDTAKRPNLEPIRKASHLVGECISKNGYVIYESTVYPGCTKDYCVPIIESVSGLKHNVDFFTGYSPERINPGDKEHRLTSILKITSGSTPEAADFIDALYNSIIDAGTYKAQSIEVAEAAKVIENTQRDINIALMNELSVIFHRLNIDTLDVLEAAGTKWNFMPFRPGLVGGHCIGVDPYYLTHKAQEIGYHPEIILAGRRINDGMGRHVVDLVSRKMMKRGFPVVDSNILILGLTFKENCPDLRNSRVIDIIDGFKDLNAEVHVHDPWATPEEVKSIYNVDLQADPLRHGHYDAIILAVGHNEYTKMGADKIRALGKPNAIFFDIKAAFGRDESDGRL